MTPLRLGAHLDLIQTPPSGPELNRSPTPTNQSMEQAVETTTNNLAIFASRTEQASQQPDLESVLRAWSVGDKCTWPKCSSRAVFKSEPLLYKHVVNVHTDPLVCSVPECTYQKPFSRRSDLRRHEQSAHSAERRFICQAPFCDAQIKEFARKDHLTKHMRERHDNYFCPLNHCPRGTKESFAKPENVAKHIATEHGVYECALYACAQSPSSRFSKHSLQAHLRNHHHVDYHSTSNVIAGMEKRRSNTTTEADLRRRHLVRHQCMSCKKQHQTTEVQAT